MTETAGTAGQTTDAAGQLLTVRDVADRLKIHTGTVWRFAALADMGQCDFPRPLRLAPKTIRWRLADVLAYLDRLANTRSR